MFVPAHNSKYLEKLSSCDTDGIILDVEDGVPQSKKSIARKNIAIAVKEGCFERKNNIYVRINAIESSEFIKDIEELTLIGIDGFMPSKIETRDEIYFLDGLLEFFERKKNIPVGTFKLAPLIETTKAIENINEIAKNKRLVALCLGGEDYLNDLGSVFTYQESALLYPRARLVNAARANGLLPIDTPYLDIKDLEGLEKAEKLAYKNGFSGCLVLSPRQIEVVNNVFSPDKEEIEMSKRIIEAVELANETGESGVAMIDGGMVGPPMKKRAQFVLKQIE